MKDKSKRLTVVNTGKKPSEKKDMQQVDVQPSSSSSSHALGFNPNLYLLKSVWDSVFEIKTDVSGQKYIFGKLPVVTKYGITMYADNGEVEVESIYAGLPIDRQTLIWKDGVLMVNPELDLGGGGGIDENGLRDYLTRNDYAKKSDITTALNGYATTSSLNAVSTKLNDFLEGSDTDTVINKWKELETFLSGLTESDNLATILSTKWTTDNSLINKWNTAYGWGNHASVGYALKSYVDDTFVTIKGNEDVTGVHDFVNGLKIGNIKLSKSQEGVVYLEGNLVVKGGVTMYALDEVTVDSIIDSLPLASTSEYGIAKFNPSNFVINEDGFVTIIGGSGGLDTEELAEYLATNKYATQGWVEGKGYITSSALNGYATQSWVTNQKYITGITSAMVVSALGFTPYNSANFTKTNIKSTLGISDWALASSKPSYNFSEIGTKPTTLGGYGITDAKISNGVITLGSATITPLTSHQPIYNLTLQAGTFSAKTFDPNGSAQTVNIPTTTSHISEGGNLYFTDARAVSALKSITDTLAKDIATKWTQNDTKISNWDTAFGWGDHSKQDYTTNAYVNNTFVTLGSKQTITGEKNFTGGLKVNGSPIYYDATNKYWKLEGDLLITGGVSMYSDDSEFTPSTIMDALLYDESTLGINDNGELYVKGGNGGSTTKYPLTWSGFNQGSYDGSVAQSFYIPTKLSEFVNDKSFATTSDLSGYLPLSGGTLSGKLIIKYDGTSNAINIGSLGSVSYIESTKSTQLYVDDGGYPALKVTAGVGYPIFRYNYTDNKVWHSGNDGAGSGLDADTLDGYDSSNFIYQENWSSLTSADGFINHFSSKFGSGLFGGKIKGWNNISGLEDVSWGYVLMYGQNDYSSSSMFAGGGLLIPSYGRRAYLLETNGAGGNIKITPHRIITDDIIGNYNAGSATKLQTARTIWGQSFDGSGDVTGNLTVGNGNLILNNNKELQWKNTNGENVSIITYSNNNALSIGTGVAKAGRPLYIRGLNVYLQYGTDHTCGLYLKNTGNVLIGTDTDSGYKLDVNGTIHTNSRLLVDTIPIYKSQNDVLYIDGNLVVRGGVTMYAENEVDIPSIIDSLPIASNTALGVASFDSSYFSVDANGMVSLTNVPSSVSLLGDLLNVDSSINSVASVDRVLYQPAGSATWTWKELTSSGVVGDYLPLSGGRITNDAFGGIEIYRSNSNATSAISYSNSANGWLGGIGIGGSGSDFPYGPIFLDRNQNVRSILHNGNYSSYALPLSGGQMSGHIYMTGAKADSSIGNTTQIVFGTPSDNHVCITSNGHGIVINRSLSDTSNQIALYAEADGESFIHSHLRIHGNLFSNIFFSHGGSLAKQSDASMYTWDNNLQINKIAGMTYVKTLLNFDLVNETATFNLNSQLRFNSNMFWVSDSTNPYMALVQGGYNWYVQVAQGYMFLGAGSINSLRIDASGNILTPGGITMYSDQRKKTILNNVELTLQQIADAPLIEHYYNSDQDKTTHVGSIAQYWAGLNDWFCKLDKEGFYTMEIQNCALASAISIARHLEKYESKTDRTIRKMKQRIQELEDKLERMEGGNYGC